MSDENSMKNEEGSEAARQIRDAMKRYVATIGKPEHVAATLAVNVAVLLAEPHGDVDLGPEDLLRAQLAGWQGLASRDELLILNAVVDVLERRRNQPRGALAINAVDGALLADSLTDNLGDALVSATIAQLQLTRARKT